MIQLTHVSKSFNEVYVLKDINISFPKYGIVVIYGPSGCGKSTLLNIISSIYPCEGEVTFNGRHYSTLKEDDKDMLRNQRMGFIFQDYKLFEFDTVKNNVMLAIDIKCSDKKSDKERRVNDLLNLVGLEDKANELVSNLSGGEKQRISLARAIANSPQLLLADEPTGNLDNKNSEIVMSLLEKISRRTLVILVSHDEALTKKYADEIVYMKDGRIQKIEYNNHNHHVDYLPLIHINPKENKPKLPLGFCISHTLNNAKRRKWRSIFVFLTTSLGLIGVGLGSVISNIISTNLYKSYSSIIDGNKVIMSSEAVQTSKVEINSASYDDVNYLRDQYSGDVTHLGTYYWNNLDSMFSYYDLSLENETLNKTLPEYRMKHFNEFEFISNCKTVIYPEQVKEIEDDEVILGLTYPLLNEICFQLYITRKVESFNTYLRSHDLYIKLSLENYNWGYANFFSLKIAGFTMSNKVCLYHSNPMWNEYIFEERCGFSSTNLLSMNSKNPWDLKKTYFLEFNSHRDQFLEDIAFKQEYRLLTAEILDDKYYSTLYKGYLSKECPRVGILLINNKKEIKGYLSNYFKKSSKHIKYSIFGSSGGYAIYPENLMMGFAKKTYLSCEKDYIDDAIDLTAYIKYEDSNNINAPDNVVEGHFTKPSANGLSFSPQYNLLDGNTPTNYHEIVISRGIVNRFNLSHPINKTIYLAFPLKEELLPNGYLSRDYQTASLKIVGVSDSDKLVISHKEEWTVVFFQAMLGVSCLDLTITSVAFEVDENSENEVIPILSRAFPNYEVNCPISSVKSSINEICGYIEKILLILSISSVIISSLLLGICNYLHFMEIKKDIGLIRCIGISKRESAKFIYVHSFLMALISFLLATLQLFVICVFLSKTMSNLLYVESSFIFNPLAILYMFIVSMSIAFISSIFIQNKVNKLDPLSCLR